MPFTARVQVSFLIQSARDIRKALLSNMRFANEVLTRQQPFQMQQSESSFEIIGRFELRLPQNAFPMNPQGLQNSNPSVGQSFTQVEATNLSPITPGEDMDTNQDSEDQIQNNPEPEFQLRAMKSENAFVDVSIAKSASVKDLKVRLMTFLCFLFRIQSIFLFGFKSN